MNLLSCFGTLQDTRRAQGLRVSLSQLLTMVFFSYLCGYHSYRKMAKFCKSCESILIPLLGLKHGVPSYITFRDVLQRLDEAASIRAFNVWAGGYTSGALGEYLSGDGKVLGATVSDVFLRTQNFKSVVSIFAQETGLVQQISVYERNQSVETAVLRGMLQGLEGLGLLICLDALHCQKKQ